MVFLIDKNTGAVIEPRMGFEQGWADRLVEANPDLYVVAVGEDSLGADPIVTITDGVATVAPRPSADTIYLHFALSGGDGAADLLGVNLDGSNPIHVEASLRQGADPTSAIIPVDGDWRFHLRDEMGAIYDAVLVSMIQGVVSIDYTPLANAKPAIIHVENSDLIQVQGYQVVLAAPVELKIYRTLSA